MVIRRRRKASPYADNPSRAIYREPAHWIEPHGAFERFVTSADASADWQNYRRGYPDPFAPSQKTVLAAERNAPRLLSAPNVRSHFPYAFAGIEATTTLTTTHHGSPTNSLNGPGFYYPYPAPILDLRTAKYPPYAVPRTQSRGNPYGTSLDASYGYSEGPFNANTQYL